MLSIPDFSLVVLVGAYGSGKTTFARSYLGEDSIVSRDDFRKETQFLAEIDARLRDRRRVVVDGGAEERATRATLTRMAGTRHAAPIGIVLDVKPSVARARARADRRSHAERQVADIRRRLGNFLSEGFRSVHRIDASIPFTDPQVVFHRSAVDQRHVGGPFDVVGDIHGCFEELLELLGRLGYVVAPFTAGGTDPIHVGHPDGRRLCLVGDLINRGPSSVEVLRLAMGLVEGGTGHVVPGNHDDKLARAITGTAVKISRNLARTLETLDGYPRSFVGRIATFVSNLPHHLWLDDGNLVVVHAGIPASMIGREGRSVRQFCIYGEDAGSTDHFHDWEDAYCGSATIVHGHTTVPHPTIVNRIFNIDTGCVYGGYLTALRWPETEFVSVRARRDHAENQDLRIPQVGRA